VTLNSTFDDEPFSPTGTRDAPTAGLVTGCDCDCEGGTKRRSLTVALDNGDGGG
jgi:hypothetical protein